MKTKTHRLTIPHTFAISDFTGDYEGHFTTVGDYVVKLNVHVEATTHPDGSLSLTHLPKYNRDEVAAYLSNRKFILSLGEQEEIIASYLDCVRELMSDFLFERQVAQTLYGGE